jgi:hypothetical protein
MSSVGSKRFNPERIKIKMAELGLSLPEKSE